MSIGSLIRLMDCKIFKGQRGPEDRLACEVADMLRVATLEGRLRATWTHIPHEVGGGNNRASAVRYALAKAMGMIAGSGDYVFVWPDGGGWIELKTPVGSLNPKQRDFREWCLTSDCNHAVCRTVEDVEATLMAWGVLRAKT